MVVWHSVRSATYLARTQTSFCPLASSIPRVRVQNQRLFLPPVAGSIRASQRRFASSLENTHYSDHSNQSTETKQDTQSQEQEDTEIERVEPATEQNAGNTTAATTATATATATETVSTPIPSTTAPETPWYLDVEPPRHPTLVPEPTPLPPTPADSPALVEPLIKFVGEDLGMDELRVMDLRSLDPPPALGPKLIMLIGTARGERHLHVSADRLVRWCRGHGVTAHADGLLGRNELKLKMRRRARRAKLLGDSSWDKGDDGVSTGWVCVNLGTVGGGAAEEVEVLDEQGRVSGFGIPVVGTTLVVQLMTEAKRVELGLERLWGGVLKKSDKVKEEVENARRLGSAQGDGRQHRPFLGGGRGRAGGTGGPWEQRRYMSSITNASTIPTNRNSSPPPPTMPGARHSSPADNEVGPLSTADLPTLYQALSYNADQKLLLMSKLRAYITGLRDSIARAELNFRAKERTPLLRLSDLATSHLPPSETWPFRLFLVCHAMQLERSDCLQELRALVAEMKQSGHALARPDCLLALRAVLSSRRVGLPLRDRAEVAADLLRTLHERCGAGSSASVLANDVITALQCGLASSVPVIESQDHTKRAALGDLASQKVVAEAGREARALAASLGHLRARSGLPCPSEADLCALMEARSASGDWDGFWEAWRLPARHGAARSRGLYSWLFRHAASLGREDLAAEAVRRCLPEAAAEVPPVRVTFAVADEAKRCILVADPRAQLELEANEKSGEPAHRLSEFARALYSLRFQ